MGTHSCRGLNSNPSPSWQPPTLRVEVQDTASFASVASACGVAELVRPRRSGPPGAPGVNKSSELVSNLEGVDVNRENIRPRLMSQNHL